MSTTIDQRVVEMRFDNANFESNVKTSLSTLDKLKKALKLDGASKGLENIQTASKKVNLAPMANAADAVTQRFSYMQMTIQHQLNQIVDSAVNAGKRMVSALTIDPVKTGLQEYETQIGAVQTILANTQHNGTTLDQVNSALDTLNTYADKTIYNFTEMTRNIGTFTAAGVDLQTSVESIQGIANLAAVSGSTSQQASTAMYQLSQALAAGKVSLMDWNSVVNAGMGGKVFQDALVRTSELLKTGAKEAINTYGSFRESLTQGEWLTTEVLTETLKQFAGAYSEADLVAQGFTEKQAKEIAAMAVTAEEAATKVKTFTQLWDTLKEAAQSGWTQTWELIIGDFEEAKELLSGISDTVGEFINKISESRNKLLGGALKSPWKKLTDGLTEAGVSVDSFQNKVRELYDEGKKDGAFDKLIEKEGSFEKACRSGAISTDMLKKAVKDLSGGFEDLKDVQAGLKFGDNSEDVKKVQKALQDLGYDFKKYGVDGIIGEETEGIIKKFQEMNGLEVTGVVDEKTLKALEEANKKTGSFKGNVDELIDSLDEMGGREKIIESFKNIFLNLGIVFGAIGKAYRNIFPPMVSDDISKAIDKFHEFAMNLKMDGETFGKIRRIFEGLFSVMHIVATLAGGALKFGFTILSKILSVFGTDVLGLVASIADIITKFHDWLFEGNLLVRMIDNLIGKLPGLVDKFKEWMVSFKETPAVQKFVEILGKIKKTFTDLTTMELNADSISKWVVNLKDSFLELAKSIPDIIKQLASDIVSGLDILTGGAITKIKKFMSSFATTPEMEAFANAMGRLARGISGLVSIIGETASGIWDKATSIGKNIIEGLQNGISEGTGDVVGKIIEVAANLINAFCDMLGIHSPSTVAFEWGQNIIQGLINGIKSIIGKIVEVGSDIADKVKEFGEPLFNATKETISNFTEKAKEFSSKIDWNKVLLGGLAVGSLATIFKVCNTILALTEPLSSISNVVEAFADSIRDVGKAQAKNLNREALMKTAIAIGVLVASISLLVYVAGDNYGQIWNAVGVIVVLAGVLAALSIAMDKLGSASATFEKGKFKIDGIKQSLVSIGIAVLLLAVTAKLIGDLDPEEAKQGFIGLAGIMVAVLSFIKISAKIAKSGGDISSFGKTMKQIAVAMLLMLAVIKISSMMDPANILKGLIVIEAFVLITLQMAVANRIAGGNAEKFGKTMKQMAVAMLLMLGVVKLASMMQPEDLIIGIAIIECFVLIAIEMGIANRIAGGQATKFGGTMVKMAIAMGLMVGVVKLISMLDPDTILKGVIGIQAFVLIIAEMLLVAKLGGKVNNVASTILSMSLAIGILAGVCVLISMMDTTQLAKGLVAVSVLGLVMTAMLKFSSGLTAAPEGKSAMGSIIALSVAIGVMALAVAGLAQIPTEQLVTSTAVLAILMGMFGLMTKLASGAKASLSGIILMGVVMAMLAGLLYAIDAIPIESSLTTTISLILLLKALAQAVNTIGDTKVNLKTAIPMLGTMIVAVGLIALILSTMANFTKNPQAILPIATSLSAVMLALSASALIISKIGPFATASIGGAAAMMALVTAFGAIIIGIAAWVGSLDGAEQALDGAIMVLGKVGEAFGKLIGNFIGGIGSGIAKQLPTISEAITDFVNNFTGIDASSLSGVSTLAEVITAIGAASIVDGIANVLNFSKQTPIEQFATNAEQLVDAVKGISEKLKGVTINEEQIAAVAKAGELFVTLANSIPSTGGWLQKIAGVKDLGTFGDSIGSYVKELIKINDAVNVEGFSFNSTAIEAFATAGTSFSTLVNSIPATGGWLQKIAGVKDLGNFGTSISTYIGELKTINEEIGSGYQVNTGAITAFATAGSSFSTLVNSIPATDGWLQKITGIKSLGTFGTDISLYITEMKKVNDALGEEYTFNTDAIKQAVGAGTALAGLESSLESMGGVIGFFAGEKNLGDFGTNIGYFADGIGKLKEAAGENGISENLVTSVTNAGKAIIALNDALPEEGFFDSKITMTDFADYITDFSDAIASFSSTASTIDSNAINIAITAANRIKFLISSIANLDTTGIAAFTGIGTGGVGADGAAYKIAQAMAAFSEKVAGIDTAAVSTAASTGLKIKTLIAGLVGLDYSGVESFKPEKIGSAMKAYADKVAGIDTSTVSNSISAANRLKTFISSLTGLDKSGISNFSPGSIGRALSSYATNVTGIDISSIANSIAGANKIKSFISSLAGLDTSGVSSFKTAVSTLAETNIGEAAKSLKGSTKNMSSVGSSMVDSIAKGLKSKSSSLSSTATTLANSITKGMKSKASTFQKTGADLMVKLITGIKSKSTSVSSTMKNAISSAITSIRGKYSSMSSAGKYLGEGLIQGINAKKSAAWQAGYDLGKAAVEGEKAGQQSNSPSKLTIQAGKWLGEGLVIGIGKMARAVYNSGNNLGESATKSISSALSRVTDMVDSGIETNPTIRPVLDLSDIASGVTTMGSMLDVNSSVGVMANVGAISSMMNNRNQNGSNDDVVSAINKLSKQLGNLGGNTYNVNGITYDDGSNISDAVQSIVRAARVGRRI